MIYVYLSRKTLVRHEACSEGLALFDEIAASQGRKDRVRVKWTPLAQLWLALDYRDFSWWLYDHGLIPRVSLSSANLRSADLYGADLSNANLRSADLYGADLSNANLSNADLSNANLSNADLSNADLGGADLSNADLYGARRASWDTRVDGWRCENGILVREIATNGASVSP